MMSAKWFSPFVMSDESGITGKFLTGFEKFNHIGGLLSGGDKLH